MSGCLKPREEQPSVVSSLHECVCGVAILQTMSIQSTLPYSQLLLSSPLCVSNPTNGIRAPQIIASFPGHVRGGKAA